MDGQELGLGCALHQTGPVGRGPGPRRGSQQRHEDRNGGSSHINQEYVSQDGGLPSGK